MSYMESASHIWLGQDLHISKQVSSLGKGVQVRQGTQYQAKLSSQFISPSKLLSNTIHQVIVSDEMIPLKSTIIILWKNFILAFGRICTLTVNKQMECYWWLGIPSRQQFGRGYWWVIRRKSLPKMFEDEKDILSPKLNSSVLLSFWNKMVFVNDFDWHVWLN